MIVQACINGARPAEYHPRLPFTTDEITGDAIQCIEAGAAQLHIHPRSDGNESLAAVDATMLSVRRACPGTLVGVSTGAWIEADPQRTRDRISTWRELPDYASVNLSEPDAPQVMQLLRSRGIGIEAGLATIADAERLAGLPEFTRIFRVLIEIDEQDWLIGLQVAVGIKAVLDRTGLRRPILLHGFDNTVWPFVDQAREWRCSTRVGLEDGKHLPDGSVARDNAALVAAAVAKFRPSA